MPTLPSRLLACASVLSTLAGAAACSNEEPVVPDAVHSEKVRAAAPLVAEADRQALAQGNAAFALELYGRVKASGENVVLSPISVSTALAMTYAGARGETEAQMAKALHFAPQAQLHPAMNELDAALATRGQGAKGADGGPFRLRIVNATWAQRGGSFLPGFLDTLAENYGAGLNVLDFQRAPEAARQTINRWVTQETEERIKELIPTGAINAMTALVLTNAIYFNGAWKTPFPENTAPAAFKRLDGRTVMVPTMRTEGSLRAAAGSGFQAVALPYQDERLSLLVVVPDEGKFAEVEAGLDARRLGEITAALQAQSVILALPRFKFETPVDLKKALVELGMAAAFDAGAADFSGIDGTRSLFIQTVLHKAFIAVAEKGTEAAAATAVIVGRTSAPLGLHITADRPFLFFLRDEPTGAILFMGRVQDPSLTSGG
jgi:serpin B